jgi:hypothetical protein
MPEHNLNSLAQSVFPGSWRAGSRRGQAERLLYLWSARRARPRSGWSGGTGRRTGLKIPRPSLVMRVRPPPPAPTERSALGFGKHALKLSRRAGEFGFEAELER